MYNLDQSRPLKYNVLCVENTGGNIPLGKPRPNERILLKWMIRKKKQDDIS
jgi:hypothetical protein